MAQVLTKVDNLDQWNELMVQKSLKEGGKMCLLNLLVESHFKLSIILLWEKCIAT